MNGYHEFGKPGPENERTMAEIEAGHPVPSIAGERIPLRQPLLPIVYPTLDELRSLILLRSKWDGRNDNDH